MTVSIRITIGETSLEGELFDTPTGAAIARMLPIEAHPHEWGDEFYFEIPLTMELEPGATTLVKSGDIGYWPPGRALAIFFGPTPLSRGADPVPAGEVNIAGRITGDSRELRKEKGRAFIRIERT
jgi:uncharacterized protein